MEENGAGADAKLGLDTTEWEAGLKRAQASGDAWAKNVVNTFTSAATSIGRATGAAVGAVVAGPIGAIVGAEVGKTLGKAVAATLGQELTDDISRTFSRVTDMFRKVDASKGANQTWRQVSAAANFAFREIENFSARTADAVREDLTKAFNLVAKPVGVILDGVQELAVEVGLVDAGAKRWGDTFRGVGDAGREIILGIVEGLGYVGATLSNAAADVLTFGANFAATGGIAGMMLETTLFETGEFVMEFARLGGMLAEGLAEPIIAGAEAAALGLELFLGDFAEFVKSFANVGAGLATALTEPIGRAVGTMLDGLVKLAQNIERVRPGALGKDVMEFANGFAAMGGGKGFAADLQGRVAGDVKGVFDAIGKAADDGVAGFKLGRDAKFGNVLRDQLQLGVQAMLEKAGIGVMAGGGQVGRLAKGMFDIANGLAGGAFALQVDPEAVGKRWRGAADEFLKKGAAGRKGPEGGVQEVFTSDALTAGSREAVNAIQRAMSTNNYSTAAERQAAAAEAAAERQKEANIHLKNIADFMEKNKLIIAAM